VLEVVAHVIAAEGQHGKGVPAHGARLEIQRGGGDIFVWICIQVLPSHSQVSDLGVYEPSEFITSPPKSTARLRTVS